MYKKKSPLLSVAIPVFNGEKYIFDCIQSVLQQNFIDYELLILDNCSTDNTAIVVNNISDKRIRYIKNKKNLGSIGNFNKCIKESKGEFFLLLPHDDLLLPESLEEYVKNFDNLDVGFVYSSICIIDENSNTKNVKISHSQSQLFTPEETITNIIDNFQPIQLAMARTKILRRLDGFDIKYSVLCDVHLWLKIVFDGWNSFYNVDPLSCTRVHDEQGQKALLNSNLKTLSKHWGKDLDKSFFIENSYNKVLLKLIRYIFEHNLSQRHNIMNIHTPLLKLFIKQHLRNLTKSILGFKISNFFHEIILLKVLLELYSLKKILIYYPYVILDEIKKKLINKFC